MRRWLIVLLFLVVFIFVAVYGVKSTSNDSEHKPISDNLPLPLIPEHESTLVIAPNGTVYYVEQSSGKILWSFSSGPSTYSAYQKFVTHEGGITNSSADRGGFYIDIDKDWQLHGYGNGFKEWKLLLSIEELLSSTPIVLDGGVLLVSKKSSVFRVDPETGEILRTFGSDNSTLNGESGDSETSTISRKHNEKLLPSDLMDVRAVKKELYMMRIDYFLQFKSVRTGEVLWYLKYAVFEAYLHCEGTENLFGRFPQTPTGTELDSRLSIRCEKQPSVIPIHGLSSLGPLFEDGWFSDGLPVGTGLSLPKGRVPDFFFGDTGLLLPKGRLQDALPEGRELFARASAQTLMLEGMASLSNFDHDNGNEHALALPTSEIRNSAYIESKNSSQAHQSPSVIYGVLALAVMAFIFYVRHAIVQVVMAIIVNVRNAVFKQQEKLYKHPNSIKLQNTAPKKRKGRKTGVSKNSISVGNGQENISDFARVSDELGLENGKLTYTIRSPNFPDDGSIVDGRKIGKLILFDKEIAKGSNGTIVLEGNYDGRPVAVKRLVRTHHDIAVKEIQNLIASDQHPNIVRWHGVEHDRDFVYLSLERCACNFHELISSCASQNQMFNGNQDHIPVTVNMQVLSTVWTNKDLELWKANGYPSTLLLKLMRDIVSGVAHLHELGIVHRDLKPQNVLAIKDRAISAKISDMGISKLLDGATSLTKHTIGYGSSGWQAPEQLRQERQTCAIDLFSLGCILFFCITGGRHPFGEPLERDVNIINDKKDLFLIDHNPEAMDLISRLLDSNPSLRPSAAEVLRHPFFWNSETRLSFLRDVSDRVELEDRESESELLDELENSAKIALGGKWDEKMDTAFINDIGRYRRYKFDSLRDLLRVIRNKLNHFRELSKEIQVLLGPVPEGFDAYFGTRFPKLLIEVYRIISTNCGEEEVFHKYFKGTQL